MCQRCRMPISDAAHIPSSYIVHAVQAWFSVLQRSPELQLRQITRRCRDALLGACKTPHAPIYEAKLSPRPFFSSGSSLSGYASAATGSPGQDVNDPEAGRQHSQSRRPDQGSSPGTHKERGLAAPDFPGEVFFVFLFLLPSLCLL
ncbi:hypothetical protein HDV64DRAFT_48982 [Trichoderma sp. TUCIM 5745]